MRMIRGKTPPPNSAAGPLPNRIWAPKFRCRPAPPKSLKLLIYIALSASDGRFSGAKTDFSAVGSGTPGPPSSDPAAASGQVPLYLIEQP